MKLPLQDKRCYLSGPIEKSTDSEWRKEPISVLQNRFGINVFDPASDPKQMWAVQLKEARKIKDYETIVRVAKSFVRKDLAIVDRMDFLIAYFDGTPTTGTHHEIINANNSKKPTLLVSNGCKVDLPSWYFGFISIEYMFDNWNQLYNYLEDVNNNKYYHDRRWSLVYELV